MGMRWPAASGMATATACPTLPEAEAWSPVAAEGSSCTGRHCPTFDSCTIYERRKEMVAAQVIVANH